MFFEHLSYTIRMFSIGGGHLPGESWHVTEGAALMVSPGSGVVAGVEKACAGDDESPVSLPTHGSHHT